MAEMSPKFEDVPPDPSALIESMRAVGYESPTAVADLIDNSIAAKSKTIDVIFDWDGPASSMAVVDDGCGMSEEGLVQAMRLGSVNPNEVRDPTDLGRFGLGLKSAGWSQARVLTVASKCVGEQAFIRQWDLDYVSATGRWSLKSLEASEASKYSDPIAEFDSGTVVTLERLDRLVGDEPREDKDARKRFLNSVKVTQIHLGIVFHRFMTGRGAISISVNGNRTKPWDPFMENHNATQPLPEETLVLGQSSVEITPFVLPHFSKLTENEHSEGAGSKGWNAHQGFYVYRAERLLVAGSWLNLKRMQQEEHLKLARIRVDLDNTLDQEWQIDVKKATASIPGPLEADFRRVAEATRKRASDAYRFRGKTVARSQAGDEALRFVWNRVKYRDGFKFRVNRSHPVVLDLRSGSREQRAAVDKALRLAEENIPIEAIVMEARESPSGGLGEPYEGKTKEVAELLAGAQRALMQKVDVRAETALRILAGVEPFSSYPEVVQIAIEELEK
ncbi:MAG: ATP-binding protein [Solirubrobacterales bacterium]|nr:ATP-binding protein [Solirubrobacterales bacterium]